jgi:hypothetical protein
MMAYDAHAARRLTTLAICLLVTLAISVAPVCGSLCSAQACSRIAQTTAESPCHFAGAAQDRAVQLHASRTCGTPEFQVADLSSFKMRQLLRAAYSKIAALEAIATPVFASFLNDDRGANGPSSPPTHGQTSPGSSVILRI